MHGTDLIKKYIDSLTIDEQVDGYDVLKQLEEGNMDSKGENNVIQTSRY